jgi:hypothetical protein
LDFDTVVDIKKLPTLDQVKRYDELIKKYGNLSLEEHDIQKLECLINELPALEVLKESDNITITSIINFNRLNKIEFFFYFFR